MLLAKSSSSFIERVPKSSRTPKISQNRHHSPSFHVISVIVMVINNPLRPRRHHHHHRHRHCHHRAVTSDSSSSIPQRRRATSKGDANPVSVAQSILASMMLIGRLFIFFVRQAKESLTRNQGR